jgi:epoxyqueuosine reductase QueG
VSVREKRQRLLAGVSVDNLDEVLSDAILSWGASAVYFGEMTGYLAPNLRHLPRCISIVTRHPLFLQDKTVKKRRLVGHYMLLDMLLEKICKMTEYLIKDLGWDALAIPIFQEIGNGNCLALFSHKTAGTCSGAGWIGKNGLLVTQKFGPRVSCGTVLTNAPVRPAEPILESRCDDCDVCVRACPAGAITGNLWKREMANGGLINRSRCQEWLLLNKRQFGEEICGICLKVCPAGEWYNGKVRISGGTPDKAV